MSAEDQDLVSLSEDEGSHRRYTRAVLSPGRKKINHTFSLLFVFKAE